MTGSDVLLLAIVVLGPVAVVLVLVGFVARRDRAEAAAGYTTQTSGRVAFDQVDPATGAVIRRAQSAVLTLPGGPGAAGGAVSGVASPAATSPAATFPDATSIPPVPAAERGTGTYFSVPPNEGRGAGLVYAISAVVFVGIVAAIMLPLALTRPDASDRDALLIALVAAVAGVAFFVTLIVGLGVLLARGRIRRIAAARPGDTVFLSPQTPELRQALRAAGFSKPHLGLGGRFVVSIGLGGIRLWKGSPDGEPRVTVPWDRIDHIQAGTLMVAAGRTTVPYRTAHVFLKGTPPIDVPLPLVGPRGQTAARASYANEVLASVAGFTTVLPSREPAARKRARG